MSLLVKLKKLVTLTPVAEYRRALRQGVAAGVEHEAILS